MLPSGGWTALSQVRDQLGGMLDALGLPPGRTEHALRVHERAVATAACGVVIADGTRPGHPVLDVNAAFERMTGYPADEMRGRSCRLLQGPKTDPAAVAHVRRALARGEPCTVTLVNYRRGGAEFWNELTIAPVHDAAGLVTHWVGTQLDVTTYVRAAEERRKLMAARDAAARERAVAAAARREVAELKHTIAVLKAKIEELAEQHGQARRAAEAARLEAAHARLDTDAVEAMLAETRAALERANLALASAPARQAPRRVSANASGAIRIPT